jgi:hypothetical protein
MGKSYNDPAEPEDDPSSLNKVMQHLNFGAEILLHRNVNVLVGYNSLRQQEMKSETGGGGSGFTFGFSARIKTVEFVFSRASYSVRNAAYSFTLAANTKSWIKNRRKL